MKTLNSGIFKLVALLPIILYIFMNRAFAQNYQWAVKIGSAINIYERTETISSNSTGLVFAGGEFSGTVDFDPGAGVFNSTPVGSCDGYISIYDPNGNLLSMIQIGSSGLDFISGITTTQTGEFYATGTIAGTADFDPTPGIYSLTPQSSQSMFLAKYDALFQLQWAFLIGDASGFCNSQSISLDNNGDVLLTGQFSGTTDFDPGTGTFNLTPNGNGDAFLAKYSSAGNYLWAFKLASLDNDMGFSVTTDAASNVLVCGLFSGNADFDPGIPVITLSASTGDCDLFVAKYNSSGNYLWAFDIGTAFAFERATGIASDNSGNVYVTGNFGGTTDFDPSAAVNNLSSSGGQDIFIAKYDPNGNYLFAFPIGGAANSDESEAINVNSSGSIFVTGKFSGTADLDPGNGIANLTSLGNQDGFLSAYDQSGNYLWAFKFGSTGQDGGYSVCSNPSGDIFLAGGFQQTVDFDPGITTVNLTSAGNEDGFLAKYSTAILSIENTLITDNRLSVFPNPFSEMITIISGMMESEIIITDVTGAVIAEIKPNSGVTCIPTNFLSPGTYFVRQSSRDEIVTKIIVKR